MIKEVPELTNPKSSCCGCGVCAIVCLKGAIKMIEDEEGFLYPEIDMSVCIKCGRCLSNCMMKLRQDAIVHVN